MTIPKVIIVTITLTLGGQEAVPVLLTLVRATLPPITQVGTLGTIFLDTSKATGQM